ncbi:MAG TPA: hypothetical protein PKA51_12215 [Kiritimatiellia bacterium]|nr:hypothetical protein [Kiritimatiellia bacterium]
MMDVFLDTSAVLPLLLNEPNTHAALAMWQEQRSAWAWSWMAVEAEAALIRRKASEAIWRQWRNLERNIAWVDPEHGWEVSLRDFNRALGLRAADAGNLFVFDRALRAIPDLKLASFDHEMREAARRINLPLV